MGDSDKKPEKGIDMDDTLKKLFDALKNYDEYLVENEYDKLKYENYEFENFTDLQTAVVELISKESAKYAEQKEDYARYEMREKILGRYEKVDAEAVYRYAFPEDSLQYCDELDSKNGKGNAIRMDISNHWSLDENGRKHCSQKVIQSVITDDLSFLFVLPKKVEKEDVVISNVNLNTYFGNRRLTRKIDKIFGLIIDVDGVTKEKQMLHLISEIEKENVPVPNFLINSGHGVHFYYIFDEPVLYHEKSYSIYPVLTNVLNAVKDLIWTSKVSDLKPERLDLNKAYSIIGSRNRKNKKLIVTAYKVKEEKCSLQYLRKFIKRPMKDEKYDISFPKCSHYTMKEAMELFPYWAVQKFPEQFPEEERKKLLEELEQRKLIPKKERTEKGVTTSRYNPKVYNWFLDLIRDPENIQHGNRYKCMFCLAVFGVKCGLAKEQVQEDLESLLPLFNSVEKKEDDNDFLMNKTHIQNALYAYKDEKSRLYTFEWIMEFTGIAYEVKTKRRENPLSQEEHLKIARKKRDELHPDGSWRAYSDGETKKNLLEYMKQNPKADMDECIASGICSRTSVYKYWEECREELGLDRKKRVTNEEKIKAYKMENPNATKADCIRELGLSKPTVYKYWDK